MTVHALLAAAAARLRTSGIPSPQVDAEALLAHVVGVPRPRLRLAHEPDAAQRKAFFDLVARRAAREPLQHLLGSAAFRHVELAVGPGVFVPRPESELLAGWAIDRLRAVIAAGGAEPIAVDLCTGSGAIACALVYEVPGVQVHAVELSPEALEYAQRNLAGTGVALHAGDIANALHELDGRVDVVVANPPYIPLGEYESVDVEARTHDPALALWSGDDGLATIRVVERVAHRLLRPDGVVGCEHADAQAESAPAVFLAPGRWRDVRDHRDLLERPRFLTAARSPD